MTVDTIASKFHVGKKKIYKILKDNNIELRKKGELKKKLDFTVKSYKNNVKYIENENSHYIAVSKIELQSFLNSYNIEFETNRQILTGKEIDILIPSKMVGIEFDGLYFHGEWRGGKSHTYHRDKTDECLNKGYSLIHIFEDEFVNHKDIVLNKLKHILKLDNNLPRIMGRKCEIKEIYKNDAKIFLNKYHIQSYTASSVYIGAFYNNELIAVMSFKKGNIGNPNWELTRFASDYNYICQGVGGKLFKYFIKHYNPSYIVSFADRRWTSNSNDNLYIKLGFELEKITPPDYKYYNCKINKYKRFHKMFYTKNKLSKLYGFPLTMTEKEMAIEAGFDRIWDCGLFKYVWKNDE